MGTYKVIPDQGNDSNLRSLRIYASVKYGFAKIFKYLIAHKYPCVPNDCIVVVSKCTRKNIQNITKKLKHCES